MKKQRKAQNKVTKSNSQKRTTGVKSDATKPDAIEISEDEFWGVYEPIANHLVGDEGGAGWACDDDQERMFETYGKEMEFVCAQDPRTVWTLLEADGKRYVKSGLRYVNRIAIS